MSELHNTPEELEVRRLARLLKVDAEELDALRAVGADDLAVLRDQVAAKLYDEHTESWQRAVAVAGVVPAGLAARLSEHALGAVLSARVTALTPPDKAVDIAAKLHPSFMADVAVEVDPRKISDIVVALPPRTIAAVGRELAAREEWLVMADFVAAVTEPALRATVEALDEASILRIAPLLQDPDRLTQVVAMLTDARVERVREAAAAEGLEAHLAHVADAVDGDQAARLRG